MAETEPATVALTIDDKPYMLRPTLPAMRTIGRAFGGYAPILRALSDVNPDALVLVIVAGTGTPMAGPVAARLEDAIYAHGFEDLIAPLVRFVGICMAGGREPAAAGPKPAGEAVTHRGATGDGKGPAESEAHDAESDATSRATAA